MSTRNLRIDAVRRSLAVNYSPAPEEQLLFVDATLDGLLPAPSAGAAVHGFVAAANLGLFAGSTFDPSQSGASIQQGEFDQAGPSIRFVLSVRGVCRYAMRVLVDDLTWALGMRQIEALSLTGNGPRNEQLINAGEVLDAMVTLDRYPGAFRETAMPVDVVDVGFGFGIRLYFHRLLSEDEADSVENAVFTWRTAVRHFQSADGDPQSSPELLLGRSGRAWKELAVHFKAFPHAPEGPLRMLQNMLGRWVREGIPLQAASVRV